MGQLICWSADEIPAALARVESRSKELFGDSGVFMEEYHPASHHIEVQVGVSICPYIRETTRWLNV